MTQIALPPATRSVGSADPPGDMNAVITALLAMGAITYITPTGDTSGTADTANLLTALAALPAAGGTVWLAPGTFYITCGSVTITSVFVHIRGCGRWATIIRAVGTGDCLRIYNTDTTGKLTGGGVLDLSIDGDSAGAGSAGLHYGDMRAGELRVSIRNFSGAGSIGMYFDNQNSWTEECHGYIWLSNNTQNLVFDVSGATTSTNSYGYSDFNIEILAKANQDALVLQNGALLYHSRVSVKANFTGTSVANTSAAIRITGTVPAGHPDAGTGSKIVNSRFDFMAECATGGGTPPQTINFGNTSLNSLIGCTGIIDFTLGALAFATTNATVLAAAGAFMYMGFVAGDANLNQATSGLGQGTSFLVQGVLIYGRSLLAQTTGIMLIDKGDFFQQTLNQNITISLVGGGSAYNSAQRKTVIIIQAASGGPYTVTWPHNGSPTTASPTVNWAGGTAPTMSAGAGAMDKYELVTYDGAVWIASALQAVS